MSLEECEWDPLFWIQIAPAHTSKLYYLVVDGISCYSDNHMMISLPIGHCNKFVLCFSLQRRMMGVWRLPSATPRTWCWWFPASCRFRSGIPSCTGALARLSGTPSPTSSARRRESKSYLTNHTLLRLALLRAHLLSNMMLIIQFIFLVIFCWFDSNSCKESFVKLLTCLLTLWFSNMSAHRLVHSFIHSFIQWLSDSFTDLYMNSFACALFYRFTF